jgi:hypothetical protein
MYNCMPEAVYILISFFRPLKQNLWHAFLMQMYIFNAKQFIGLSGQMETFAARAWMISKW